MNASSRRGDYLVEMIIATVLFLFSLQQYFNLRSGMNATVVENYALDQIAMVGQGLRNYIHAHRKELLDLPAFQRNENQEKTVFTPTDTFLNSTVSNYIPQNKNFSELRNVWGDRYRIVFVRNKNAARAEQYGAGTDMITSYVLATGGTHKQHSAGTEEGDRWINFRMRQLAYRGGPSFAFVENAQSGLRLRSNAWETTEGLAAVGARAGDIGYLVSANTDDTKTDKALSRKELGYTDANGNTVIDPEANRMHADLRTSSKNILNVQNLTSQSVEVSGLRLDTTLYDSEDDAEKACRNNWMYIYDRNNKKHLVDADGNVHDDTTAGSAVIDTFGMAGERLPVDNEGRLFYISPKEFHKVGGTKITASTRNASGTTSYITAVQPRLGICRTINGQRTLAYLGDSRAEDSVSFVLSAVDGDFIPMFYCPGQDSNVAGGGTIESFTGGSRLHASNQTFTSTTAQASGIFASGTNAIKPRLFVIPHIVSSGPMSYPLQGIRAYAETVGNEGWIIRMGAMVDTHKGSLYNAQTGTTNKRSYWVGNSGGSSTNKTGYMTLKELNAQSDNSVAADESSYLSYLQAVVIGVCSGKKQTF